MHRLLRALVPVVVVGGLLAAPATAAAPPVTPDQIRAHLDALGAIAAAHGNTRAAGTPGADATADFLAERLREMGWTVATPAVSFPYFEERSAPVLGSFRPGRDFVSMRGSGAGDVTARVRVVLAERCPARALRRVRRGEIVLWPFFRCATERAAAMVRARGGVALLTDAGPSTFPIRWTLVRPAPIPVIGARTTVLVRIARSAARLRVRVDATNGRRTARNVVAELPGGREVVMAGGHLDSVPEGPGINDNGSGLAALLEVARRMPAERRRATVRLGFWTAEEYGLFGSSQYVRSLPRGERRRLSAYLNFDMVGSPNGVLEVYDSDNAVERALRRAIPGRERETQLALGSSDHTAFARAGIRVGGVYTGSTERSNRRPRDPCYHRACDGPTNIDTALAARVATAAQRAITALAAP